MIYILQTSLVWLILYLFYKSFLQKTTFYLLNRIYLISALIIGLILPFSQLWFTSSYSIYQFEAVEIIANASHITNKNSASEISLNWLNIIYVIGFIIAMARFVFGLYKISQFSSGAIITQNDGHTLVYTNKKHLPFSFLNKVFISRYYPENDKLSTIIEHEKIHVNQGHSYDILFLELIHVLFWFNPIVLWLKRELKHVHEYYTDFHVTLNTSVNHSAYSNILLNQHSIDYKPQIANHFFNSKIKNRLIMLQRKKSTKSNYLRYLVALPIVALMAVLFSSSTPFNTHLKGLHYNDYSLISNDTIPDDDKVYKTLEEMPRFPGCEDQNLDLRSKDGCAKKKMLEYIYQNVKYPEEAQKKKIEGTAVVQFIVEKDGSVSSVMILRNPGGGTGQEAKSLIERMNDNGIVWTPGKKNGKKQRVRYTLPIKFKLGK